MCDNVQKDSLMINRFLEQKYIVLSYNILLNAWWFVFQTNLKQLIDAVRKNDVNKVSRLIVKGIDPNFIDADIGGMIFTLFLKPHRMHGVNAVYCYKYRTFHGLCTPLLIGNTGKPYKSTDSIEMPFGV